MSTAEVVDRRAQIVEGAARVLAREGFEATSMKEIAEEIGVSAGLLHYYFGTKEDLLAEVVRSLHGQLIAEWRAAMAGIEDPLERVTAGLRQAGRRLSERREIWQLIFDVYVAGFRNPVLRERVHAMANDLLAYITEEAREVDSRLPSRSPIEPAELALAVAGAVDGIALISLASGSDPAGAFRALTAMVLAYAGIAYAAAGEPVPVERMTELLQLPPGGGQR